MELNNKLVNLKNNKHENYPFSDKNYVPRIVYKEYKVIRDGVEVIKVKSKDTNPTSLPDYAKREMFWQKPPNAIYSLRNSPLSKGRRQKNGSMKYKQIRPIGKRVFTEIAVQLIKDGFKEAIINPVTHKIRAGYTRIIRAFPS